MTETMEHGYSSESTRPELSNEYQHDRVQMIFTDLYILVLWTKVASALEGLRYEGDGGQSAFWSACPVACYICKHWGKGFFSSGVGLCKKCCIRHLAPFGQKES